VEVTQEGAAPEDEDEETTNTLRIQLQNPQGDIKDIKIEY